MNEWTGLFFLGVLDITSKLVAIAQPLYIGVFFTIRRLYL